MTNQGEQRKTLITDDNPNVIAYVLAMLGAIEESNEKDAREEREEEVENHL
ncbi:MAG: hypothetical protein KW802_01505 [Candidatus Doudnabacteria bacterium]|nr:hypothetical protein [Candidatus Doudnabacteria bacterium]